MSAILLGGIAAFPCYFALQWRAKSRLDDSLDVFAAHGVGGMTGALLTGVFANAAYNAVGFNGDGYNGLLYGNAGQVTTQAISIVAVLLYSGTLTFVILKVIGLVSPLRPSEREESIGMDILNHGEEAYASSDGTLLLLTDEINGGRSH
jgi:Amt family ammonium transporter